MNKIVLSVLLTIVVGVGVVAGIHVMNEPNGNGKGDQNTMDELATLKKNIADNAKKLDALKQSIEALASAQKLAAQAQAYKIKDLANASANPGDPQELATPDLKNFMLACLSEHERLKDEAEQQQREERERQIAERRKQQEEFRQGPYDRYNTKINSMAFALNMDENQKTQYYELVKKYSEKFQESMRTLREQREANNADGNAEGSNPRDRRGGGRGGFDREAFQEITTNLQKEYTQEMGSLLTSTQLEAYNELSDRAQSFMSTSSATDTGSDRGGRGSFMMGGRGGGRGGR